MSVQDNLKLDEENFAAWNAHAWLVSFAVITVPKVSSRNTIESPTFGTF